MGPHRAAALHAYAALPALLDPAGCGDWIKELNLSLIDESADVGTLRGLKMDDVDVTTATLEPLTRLPGLFRLSRAVDVCAA